MSSSNPGLSVQLYTVREALAADLGGTLQRIADIGFRDVEPFGFVDKADAYVEGLAAAGLSAPSAHASLVGSDYAAAMAAASAIGVQTLIDPFIDPARWAARGDVEAIARELNEIASAAADQGLTVGYHNHWFELENPIDGVTPLEVLAGALDDRVVLEVDTYWAEVGGASAPDLLRRLGDRVQLIHVKDGPATRENKDQTAVGAGTLDIAAILAAAPQARRVVELDDFTGDVFDAVRDSYAWMQSNGGSE